MSAIGNKVKSVFAGREFLKNAATLVSATVLAQLITIAVSPVLTRIYNAEDFGLLAVFMSIVSVLSIIATGRYEMAIMLPENEEDAADLLVLSLAIAFLFSLTILFFVHFFNEQIALASGVEKIKNWLYLVPLSVFLLGVFQAFNYWNNRQKLFAPIAKAKVIRTSATSVSATAIGLAGLVKTGGMVWGQIVGEFLGSFYFVKQFLAKDFSAISKVSFAGMTRRCLAKRHQ